ncbi:hypothetical protein L21SP2_0125 [Salinispira pacifica]|uniref:Uncharacterized protein n=1 Tax=Salinispira pacifica TaxID=1307761 RepID=V5WDE5_9SPIO|nr:hypothetical protein L21SP2_0125 [Salinispira pacifica]
MRHLSQGQINIWRLFHNPERRAVSIVCCYNSSRTPASIF